MTILTKFQWNPVLAPVYSLGWMTAFLLTAVFCVPQTGWADDAAMLNGNTSISRGQQSKESGQNMDLRSIDLKALYRKLESIDLRLASLERERRRIDVDDTSSNRSLGKIEHSTAQERPRLEVDFSKDKQAAPAAGDLTQQQIDQMWRFFSREIHDQAWSNTGAMTARHSWERLALSGSMLQSVDCRTTLCRIHVKHDSQKAREQFRALTGTMLSYPADGAIHSVMNGADTAGTVVYFTREGYSLPNLDG